MSLKLSLHFSLNFDNTKEAMKWKTAIENSIYEAHGDNSVSPSKCVFFF